MTTQPGSKRTIEPLSGAVRGPAVNERLGHALAGSYRIDRELGTGGMAAVYLAHDVKHDRDVALKVLKPDLAAVVGAERFLNEIKTTANLQHPHILPLHDSGEANGTVWYVMPLVEGESLRDRLQRETQLPIDEALTITREVASALDYAHRHGVIHRDIKPENILLHDGRAVVADFGIALAMSRTDGGARLTETGMSLGTPHYMSPEQALGERSVDARTDVYALGVVLYEMLAGEPPFTGPTVQAVIAKVMSTPAVPVATLRTSVPAVVDAAITRALSKVPADRFKSAADFAAALRPVEGGRAETSAHGVTIPAAVRTTAPVWGFVPWALAGVALVTAGVFAARGREPNDARVTAAVVPLPLRTPTDAPLNEIGTPFSIAPDGSFLVFVGPDPEIAGTTALWRRPFDRLDASAIPGTRGAQRPRVMPDGKTVQFYKRSPNGQGNQRLEIAIVGGVATSAPIEVELKRLRDGRALLLNDSAVGGYSVVKRSDGLRGSRPGIGEIVSRSLDVSRDARWLALVRRTGQADSIVIRTPQPGTVHAVAAGISPVFIDDDLLAFRALDGSLQVGRLKADRSGFVAPAVTMVPNVALAADGTAMYAVADDGTLVYTAGGAAAQSRLTWVKPGSEQPVPNVDSRVFGGIAMAPDGRHAALAVGALAGGGDIWIADLASGTITPLTSNGVSGRPSWLRDNRTVTYLYTRIGTSAGALQEGPRVSATASRRAIDTSAPADSVRGPWPSGFVDELVWSPDERYIAMRVRSTQAAGRDIIVRRVDGDSLISFAAEAGGVHERGPRFSPDGKWLLYVSNRTGRDEIYAESFPGGGNRTQLSIDGGREATWSRDGSRVFYRGLDGWMIGAHVTRTPNLAVTARDRLFDASPYLANQYLLMYDVAPDGRFLMFKLDSQQMRTDVIVVRNWVQQLKARLAGSQ